MKNTVKRIILSILLLVATIASILPIQTNAAVRFDRINSVILDNSNRLKSINFDYSWLGGEAYISFVLLDGQIDNSPNGDSLYGYYCLHSSNPKHTFQDSLNYINSLYPAATPITHTGDPKGISSNQMPYSPGYTSIGSKTIEFGNYTIGADHPNKVYLYQWAYDGSCDGYYPDAQVAVFEMKSDGLYYIAGDGEPNIQVPFTYTVTLNKKGGTGGTNSVTVTAGTAMPSITPPTKTGYTFAGYYGGSNGTGTKYYDNNGQSAHTYDIGNSATLYANWTANNYNLTFDVNGGDSLDTSEATKTVTYDGTYGDLPVPTREGYTFQGWYTDDSFTNKISSTDDVKITSDITLVAKWLVIPGEVSTTESDDSDIETSIINDDDIVNIIPLTTEDEEKLEDGKDLYVFAEVTDISSEISDNEKELVNEELKQNEEVGLYLDISIYKQFEGEERQLIPEADGNLRINMELPENLKDKEGIKILKITNDGEVEEVEITLDGTSLTFDIDSSSTYVLVHAKEENPNTLDSIFNHIGLLIISILGIIGGVFCSTKLLRKQN